MRKATYRDIGGPTGHLARREPFEGNSMSARVLPDGSYVVRSYATDIAWQSPDGAVEVSDRYYSVTTSRQQNLCRAWLGHDPAAYREQLDREAAAREDRERAVERSNLAALDRFLPDVTLIGATAAAELQQLVYGA